MFSLVITGGGAAGIVNLTDPNITYFDIELNHWALQPDFSYLITPLPLVGCT